MKIKMMLGVVCMLLILQIVFLFVRIHDEWPPSNDKELTVMSQIRMEGITFFMARSKVERLLGKSAPPPLACKGCEPDFSYPSYQLSGRYSETLTFGSDKGHPSDWNPDPLVKEIMSTNKT